MTTRQEVSQEICFLGSNKREPPLRIWEAHNKKIMNIVRTEQEIWDLLNQCAEVEETGSSNYPGMSYEQGIKAAIEWIIGDINDHPIND